MDLEEMKSTWGELSTALSKQRKLTDDIIMRMAHEKSSSRLNRIVNMEIFGSVVSLAMLIYLLVNFHRLDNWLTLTGGIAMVVIFLGAMIMSYLIVKKAKKINIVKNSYQQTLADFADLRKALGFYKRLSIRLNILMPVLILPVASDLLFGKDLLSDLQGFGKGLLASLIIVPVMMYFLIRFYSKNISQVKEALSEVEEIE